MWAVWRYNRKHRQRAPRSTPRQGCSGGLFAFSKEVNITRTSTRFTPEEMDVAKRTDLPDFLSHLGYQVRRLGSYYTTREMDSIRIKDRRRWWHSSLPFTVAAFPPLPWDILSRG